MTPGAVTKKQLVSTLGASTLNLNGSWSYDNEGKMTSVTYPTVSNHSAQFTYLFDASARLSSMHDGNNVYDVYGVSYGPSNELLGITLYGSAETRTYNSRLQLTAITDPAFSVQYAYPATANIGKVSTLTDVTGEQVAYQYDSLQRLISAATTPASDNQYPSLAWGQGFVYDGFGNLTQKTALKGSVPTLSITVDQTTNRLAGTYDQNGNLTNDGTNSYGYDIENRMVSVNTGTFYAYDPNNRRVFKQTSSGAQEVYFFGPDGKKLGTYLPTFTGTPSWYATDVSVYFGGRRAGRGTIVGGGLAFSSSVVDRSQSVRNAGTSGASSSFYPYGEDKGTSAPNDQTKFSTYTRDSASGLDYAMDRYYNSTWGRFTSPDLSAVGSGGSLQSPTGFNLYAYVGGDPVNRVDPGGQDFEDDDIYGFFPPPQPVDFSDTDILAGVPDDWAAFGAAVTASITASFQAAESQALTDTVIGQLNGLQSGGIINGWTPGVGGVSFSLSPSETGVLAAACAADPVCLAAGGVVLAGVTIYVLYTNLPTFINAVTQAAENTLHKVDCLMQFNRALRACVEIKNPVARRDCEKAAQQAYKECLGAIGQPVQ
jgi:RHS repeat-associated protein